MNGATAAELAGALARRARPPRRATILRPRRARRGGRCIVVAEARSRTCQAAGRPAGSGRSRRGRSTSNHTVVPSPRSTPQRVDRIPTRCRPNRRRRRAMADRAHADRSLCPCRVSRRAGRRRWPGRPRARAGPTRRRAARLSAAPPWRTALAPSSLIRTCDSRSQAGLTTRCSVPLSVVSALRAAAADSTRAGSSSVSKAAASATGADPLPSYSALPFALHLRCRGKPTPARSGQQPAGRACRAARRHGTPNGVQARPTFAGPLPVESRPASAANYLFRASKYPEPAPLHRIAPRSPRDSGVHPPRRTRIPLPPCRTCLPLSRLLPRSQLPWCATGGRPSQRWRSARRLCWWRLV
jgi:hypothetical protein